MIVQLGLLSAAPEEVKGKNPQKPVDQLINESLLFEFDLKG